MKRQRRTMLRSTAAAVVALCGGLAAGAPAMKLVKTVDIARSPGTFVTLGDLTGDGRVDFLLSYLGPFSTHLQLTAVDHDGKFLWQVADRPSKPPHTRHASGARSDRGMPCRGFCVAYDIDADGKTEVLVEFHNGGRPALFLLEGATGKVKTKRASPFDMSVREPKGTTPSRPAPAAMVAHLGGKDKPASFVIKYEASQRIPTHAVALDAELKTLWHVKGKPTAMGHMPTVADINGDGRDEIVLGERVVDGDGKTIFEQNFADHADMTDALPGAGMTKRVVVSICNRGPAYCLSADGKILWRKTTKEVPHGQGIWAGDFLPQRKGLEVVILRSGHVGDFITVDADTGRTLAGFQHRAGLKDTAGHRNYPDAPVEVNWVSPGAASLWIPIDRRLVDGRGKTVGHLGENDAMVAKALRAGTRKSQLAAQAIAADLCGDGREELILYQPYHGRKIFLFTQADSAPAAKPYVHRPGVYNRKSYF